MRLPGLLLLTLALGCMAGCSILPSWAGGDDSMKTVDADGEHTLRGTLDVGQILVVDMRDPARSGYELAGASFDPEMVKLDAVLREDDEPGRVRYVFRALAPGDTRMEIRMRSRDGDHLEAYKIIDLSVEE